MIKAPPVDAGAVQGGSAPPLQQQLTAPLPAPTLDRVDIQTLDLVGALLILVAEVRAGLPLPPQGGAPGAAAPAAGSPAAGSPAAGSPGQTPQLLVRLFLQALPDEAPSEDTTAPNTNAWAVGAAQLESALSAALDKGVAAVSAWRDVPPSVLAGAQDTRAVVLAVLNGESFNAEWLRPEWLSLAPRLERYWRRRRAGRRGLSNPDHERERRGGRNDERDAS